MTSHTTPKMDVQNIISTVRQGRFCTKNINLIVDLYYIHKTIVSKFLAGFQNVDLLILISLYIGESQENYSTVGWSDFHFLRLSKMSTLLSIGYIQANSQKSANFAERPRRAHSAKF